MQNMTIIILCGLCVLISTLMIFFKNPLSVALGLLSVLLCTAGIYGMLGEHFVAAIQLIVYAGAIMVLFIFAIMLLNLKVEEDENQFSVSTLFIGLSAGIILFAIITKLLTEGTINYHPSSSIIFNSDTIKDLGGNTKVLSYALFSQGYVAFEIITIALLTAIVGAVVLAKRKVD